MKSTLHWSTLLLTLSLLYTSTSWGENTSLTPLPPACPTCCETLKPAPGISADDLMKIKYFVKYTKFAQDYSGIGAFKLINRREFVRTREWRRYRILLDNRSDIFDYKDLVVIVEPDNIRGVAVLSWTYRDPQKDRETWLWLPSLRRVRKASQNETDTPFMGSEWTTEEVSTRKWVDETYTLLGEKKLGGHTSLSNNKIYHKDTECYVIEAKPKRKEWYYSKRIAWLDKGFGGLIFDEVYDNAGRKQKVILKQYALWDNGCIPQTFLEISNLLTGNLTVVSFHDKDIKFNSGLKEDFFVEKTLMQSKW
jgi:hypothetical protein